MNICVTGGAGFIGSHLVDALIEKGHQVLVIDNLSTGCKEFVHEQATFVEMDICTGDLESLFREYNITYVFHEAAQTMVPVSMANPIFDCEVNLVGLLRVLEACRKTAVKKILMPSSAAVYGSSIELPLREESVGKPTSFYGLTKLTTESYLQLYYEQFGLPYICYRYANVYGPRQGDGGEGGVISIFMKMIQENKDLTIYGDGEQTRDFVYVQDVIEANLLGLLDEQRIGVFNISTNQETSINKLVGILSELVGKDISIHYKEAREGDIRYSRLDDSKSRNLLKWHAKTSLRDGLKYTYDYLKI